MGGRGAGGGGKGGGGGGGGGQTLDARAEKASTDWKKVNTQKYPKQLRDQAFERASLAQRLADYPRSARGSVAFKQLTKRLDKLDQTWKQVGGANFSGI